MGWKRANIETAIEARAEVRSGPPFLRLESGKDGKAKKTYLRILPPRDDLPEEFHDNFYIWAKVHMGVGPQRRAFRCLGDDGAFCPVCALQASYRDDGDEEKARAIAPKHRGLMNVVEVDEDSCVVDGGELKVWSAPRDTVFKLIESIEELQKAKRDITDPENGRDIWVKRRGKSYKDVEYEVSVVDSASEFNKGDFAILEDLYDLTTVYPFMEVGQITRLLNTGGDPFEQKALPDGKTVEGEYREVKTEEAEGERPARRRREETEEDEPRRGRGEPTEEPKSDKSEKKSSKREADEDERAAARERLRRIAEQANEEGEGDDD